MKYASVYVTAGVVALAVLWGGGCSPSERTVAVDAGRPGPMLLSVVGQPVIAAASMSIAQLKPELSAGDVVTIEGKVMGAKEPFVDGRAAMLVGDESVIVSCDLMGDESHCSTPWDVCCERAENLRAGTVLVQVTDAEGQVVKEGLRGVKGLKELSRIRVRGTVGDVSDGGQVTINAEAIQLL